MIISRDCTVTFPLTHILIDVAVYTEQCSPPRGVGRGWGGGGVVMVMEVW